MVLCKAQVLSGRVLDSSTGHPLESVAIYFDNTTIGTTTNDEGFFSIEYSDAIQSTLVISYLGYEKVFISDYRQKTDITIKLIETTSVLEAVYLNYDDGLTRKQKLQLFRKEFLGSSDFASSCKILNEDDLFLKYDNKSKVLSASSKSPILVVNKALNYAVTYDLMNFEIQFNYVEPGRDKFSINNVIYYGTSYYQEIEESNKKIQNLRNSVYLGSVQHFMRNLYHETLKEAGFIFGKKGFTVKAEDYFKLEVLENGIKKVALKDALDIFFKSRESVMQVRTDFFYVDKYGNYSPIDGVLFGGDMGKQRIGDTLPSNYIYQ